MPTTSNPPRHPDTQRLTAADVMTVAEVAELLHMPVSTVHDLARRGKIRNRKLGRRRIFVRQHIEAMLLDSEAESA